MTRWRDLDKPEHKPRDSVFISGAVIFAVGLIMTFAGMRVLTVPLFLISLSLGVTSAKSGAGSPATVLILSSLLCNSFLYVSMPIFLGLAVEKIF